MKVLVNFVIAAFGPESGGVGNVLKTYHQHLGKLGLFRTAILDQGSETPLTISADYQSFKQIAGFSVPLMNHLRATPQSVVHLHGIWHPTSWAVAYGIRHPSKLIVSPHGMLESWIVNRNKPKKAVAKFLYEKRLWGKASAFHALTEKEVEDIQKTTRTESPIFLIPNGIEILDSSPKVAVESTKLKFLYVGRFHSKKGVKYLLDAWRRFNVEFPDAELNVYGWGDNTELSTLPLLKNVFKHEPVFDESEKLQIMREHDFLVLPSFSEGLPMVILEAWSQRTPVIMTRECNLPSGFESKAAIEITPAVDSILDGLRFAASLKREQIVRMGESGRRLVEDKFALSKVIEKVARMYRWVSGETVDISDLRR